MEPIQNVGDGDLQSRVQRLEQKVLRLESLQGVAEPVPMQTVTPPQSNSLPVVAPMITSPVVVSPAQRASVESKITGTWFAVLGVLAIVFGVAFFLKYAFDNNLIGQTGRVVMGIVAGIVFMLLGDWLVRREKYRRYSFFITGGGIALLYLTLYFAFAVYHLISEPFGFGAMILVTLASMVLAVKDDSAWLAGMALLRGFLTPTLVSGVLDNQVILFSYILILNLGFLGISYFRKWPTIHLLNFIGTVILFLGWVGNYYNPGKLVSTMFFLTLYGIVFLAAPFIASLSRKIKSTTSDLAASLLNGAFYFGTSYFLLSNDYHAWLGFFFLLGALVYVLAAYVIADGHSEDRYGIYALAGVGVILLTVAIPIQLSGPWIAVAWAMEALVLNWISFQMKASDLRVAGMFAMVLAVGNLLFFSSGYLGGIESYIPIFNQRFLAYALVILSLFISAWLYNHHAVDVTQHQWFGSAFGLVGNLLFVGILSAEISAYFKKQMMVQPGLSAYDTQSNADYYARSRSLGNQENLSLSLLWGAYSAILLVVGAMRRSRSARMLALAGLAIVILKVFIFDSMSLSEGYRIVSFIVLGIVLLVISFLFYRYKERIKEFVMV